MPKSSKPDRKAPKVSELKVLPSEKTPLSPAQQRFNKLLAKVEKLGRKLQDFQRLADKVRRPHLECITELERQEFVLQRQMLLFLHERLQRKGLTAAQQKTARTIVKILLHRQADDNDAEVMALYAAYGLEEDAQLQSQALDEEMFNMVEDAMGGALDRQALEGLETPEQVLEALMQQMHAHDAAKQERHAARRAQRPPTERQRKTQEQEQDAKAALRSIYRQLASALHPDRETDPAERERKHTLMVQVNTAYERGDLTALLRLQLQAEQVDAEHIARMADDKIAALSLLLKQQVATLEEQLIDAEMALSSELGVLVRASMKEAAVLHALLDEQETQTQWVQQQRDDLERVREGDAQLKLWLREQAMLAREQAEHDAFLAHLEGSFPF